MTSLLTYDLAFKVEPVKVAYATNACMTVNTCDRLYDCIYHHSIEYSWKCTRTRTRGNVLMNTRTHPSQVYSYSSVTNVLVLILVLVKMYSAPGLINMNCSLYDY